MANFTRCLSFFAVPILIFLTVFILFLISSLFSLSIMIKTQKEAIEIKGNDFRIQELLEIEEKIEKANQIIGQINIKQNEMVLWTLILEEISEIMPDGARLNNFSYRKSDNTISLIGWAESREDVLLFGESLEESRFFEQVNSPLSNLLKRKNIDFNFTLKPTLY